MGDGDSDTERALVNRREEGGYLYDKKKKKEHK